MPRFYDSQGNAHVLAEQIGRGGEGAVYLCQGNTELVAKIYYEPITNEKAQKLRLMAENKNARLLKFAAWVVETLHDKPNGRTVGFLMPNIKAKEIHELYSLKSRRIHFPQATWHYLVHTATNLARAFYSLHKYSHVIGDVNHGNCVVLADGTVKLIDCDSYAISNGKTRFPCEVGVATHLAPELQRANLREIERTPEHDNFALAVVIFQLLFLGRHPFAGNYLGEKDKTLEDCIREFRFAYGKKAKTRKVQQPPGTLCLDEVSPRITELFERAFDANTTRPKPREWVEALVNLSNNLDQCGLNPGHRFFSGLVACPWCRIESQTGLMLFPFVFSEEHIEGEMHFNIFTVEKLIDNLGTNGNLPVKLPKSLALLEPEPTTEVLENAKLKRNHQFLYVGLYFIALIALNAVLGIGLGTFFGICLMIYLYSLINAEGRQLQDDLMLSWTTAERKLNEIEKEWTLSASPHNIFFGIKELKEKVRDYKKFQLKTRKDLTGLEQKHQHREFINHLRSYRLAKNEIAGVSAEERESLVAKKIWTAAEIDKKRLLKHYNLDPDLMKNLLQWRKDLEGNFVYHENSEMLEKKKTDFIDENRKISRRIENEIGQSLETLNKNSLEARQNQQLLIPKSEAIAKEVAQSKSNYKAVKDNSMALVSLLVITFIIPFFGSVFSNANSHEVLLAPPQQKTIQTASGNAVKTENYSPESFPFSDESLTKEEMENLAVPDENITDQAIEDLGFSTRRNLSNNLIRQAIWLIKDSKNNFTRAEAKLKFAQRVDEWNTKAFEEFGKTLYNKRLYEESLAFFTTFFPDENGNVISLYIGMNYLELKKYEEASEYLTKAVKKDPATLPYYKLGLAYKGLRDYEAAKKSFEYAIQMDSSNIDAHYELGYMYFKLKDKEAFNKQYGKLLDLDSKKASQLLENSYKLPPKLPKREASGTGEGSGSGEGGSFRDDSKEINKPVQTGSGSGTGRGSSGGISSDRPSDSGGGSSN